MKKFATTVARIVERGFYSWNGKDLLGITVPRSTSYESISYELILDRLGLNDALWLCRAEPDLVAHWRRYAVWCARQVQHLMIDPRSVAALDVAERHAVGLASDHELAAARTDAEAVESRLSKPFNWRFSREKAIHSAAVAAVFAVTAYPKMVCVASQARSAMGQFGNYKYGANLNDNWTEWNISGSAIAAAYRSQSAAFKQLVTTGTLPPVETSQVEQAFFTEYVILANSNYAVTARPIAAGTPRACWQVIFYQQVFGKWEFIRSTSWHPRVPGPGCWSPWFRPCLHSTYTVVIQDWLEGRPVEGRPNG